MTNRYEFEIGLTQGGLTNLEVLATPVIPPRSIFTPYSEVLPLGSGASRGVGAPTATWRWDFITRAQRDMLRTFCVGASAPVCIRTYTRDTVDSAKEFSCDMIWPVMEEEVSASRRLDFAIEFRNLVLLSE
jgi:hypothetical protein